MKRTIQIFVFAILPFLYGCKVDCPGFPMKFAMWKSYLPNDSIVFVSHTDTVIFIVDYSEATKPYSFSRNCDCDCGNVSMEFRAADDYTAIQFNEIIGVGYFVDNTMEVSFSLIFGKNSSNIKNYQTFDSSGNFLSINSNYELVNYCFNGRELENVCKLIGSAAMGTNTMYVYKGLGLIAFEDNDGTMWRLLEK